MGTSNEIIRVEHVSKVFDGGVQALDDCSLSIARGEVVAIIGDSAKHSTANYQALKEMPWTEAERTEVEKQFSNLASIPNYPGYYYIDRYTNFAFLSAYNNDADPSTEMLSYINTINTT